MSQEYSQAILNDYSSDIKNQISSCDNLDSLENIRLESLGKKGKLSLWLADLRNMDAELRKDAGRMLNIAKSEIMAAIEEKKYQLEQRQLSERLSQDKIDVTLPVRPYHQGSIHPITKVTNEIAEIFARLGFDYAEGPLIEDDFHNFTALNIPKSHPAREMHDTFYLHNNENGDARMLRTHTSPVQIRYMKNNQPPLRMIAPGKTFRCDSDITHTPMFHQVEGLLIEKNANMAQLKWVIDYFLKEFFELDEVPHRLRPSFFPFTEPSAEVDIACRKEQGRLIIGEGDDWLEILGCGMVHTNVLLACDIDPAKYRGFAFGMGIERLAMLKYGMRDLRQFFEGDIRWLSHYGHRFM